MSGKERLLELLYLLYSKTDENHALTINEIVTHFEAKRVVTYRKTVQADIRLLIQFGMDIVEVKGNPLRYFCASRQFELPEIKLLLDAVLSSKLITPKKSAALVDKLLTIAGEHQAQQLRQQLSAKGRVKPENESVYYTIDLLHTVIEEGRQISFQYYSYLPTKEKVYRQDGAPYVFSPYALLWNEDKYYAIGYSPKHGRVVTFRVDRMAVPTILDEPAVPAPAEFNAAEYSVQVFDMYDGETAMVTLRCKSEHINTIIDRFGEAVPIEIENKAWFRVSAEVSVSATFFAWMFQFGGEVQIIAPTGVCKQYKQMLKAAKNI